MTINQSAVDELRGVLAADGYHVDVEESAPGVRVRITAGPDACAECLVPKPLMRGMLHAQLGVPEEEITLIYPAEDGETEGTGA